MAVSTTSLTVALADVTFNMWGFSHPQLQKEGDKVSKVKIEFIEIVDVEREGKKPYKRLDFEMGGSPSSCLPADILNAQVAVKKGNAVGVSTLLRELQAYAKEEGLENTEAFVSFPSEGVFDIERGKDNDKGYATFTLTYKGKVTDFIA